MRIVFFSHYYPPEVNAPASRAAEHARIWARAGHDVTIVTCAPNHPTGKLYPGYRNGLCSSETIDGVRILRIWTFIAANEGFLLRVLNYISYAASAVVTTIWLRRPDVVVSTSPQFFCGLVGLVAKALRRTPWVLEIRDLWPESIVSVGAMPKGRLIRGLEWLEALAYRRADRIVSVTRSFVAHIASRGAGSDKIAVIENGVDLARFVPVDDGAEFKRRFGLENRFVAAYVGTHGMAHGLDTILDAAELSRGWPDIVFLLVGDGAERRRLERRKFERGLDNVVMLGQLPKEEMPNVWAATDVSLILLRREQLFKTVLPSKMFEAMAMRRPIILGVEGEASALLEAAGAGLAITPQSAQELAAAVRRLASDPALCERMGSAGAAHVRQHYDRAALAMRYLDLLQSAAGIAPPRSASRRSETAY